MEHLTAVMVENGFTPIERVSGGISMMPMWVNVIFLISAFRNLLLHRLNADKKVYRFTSRKVRCFPVTMPPNC